MPIKDIQGLQHITEQLFTLSEKPNWNSSDRARNATLLSLAAALRDGAELRDLQAGELSRKAREMHLPVPYFERTDYSKRERDAIVWREFLRSGEIPAEYRDETVGNGKPEYLQGSMGSFVPRDFFAGVKELLRFYDPILDPDVVTYVETTHGRPKQFGYMGDISAIASVIGENANESANETDIAAPGAVDLWAYSYRTPLWRLSIETLQDLDELISAVDLFQKFSVQRISRGVAADQMTGNGSGKTLGLIPSLTVAGATQIVASGSSETTGGNETGKTSIGISDLNNLMYAVDWRYTADDPRTGFWMHPLTVSYLSRILDKQGYPLLRLVDNKYTIFARPVYISPSMPELAAGNVCALYFSPSYWVCRHATAGDRVQLFSQAVGLAEKGEVGLRSYSRYDGALLADGQAGNFPGAMLVNHS